MKKETLTKIEKGQCYKHKKLDVFKKITNSENAHIRNNIYCIHISLVENSKQISTGIFHNMFEDDFCLISEQEFEKARADVLEYFKN